MKDKIAVAVLAAALMIVGWLGHSVPQEKFGSAMGGFAATVATTSVSAIAAGGINTLVATSTCSATIITAQTAIMLTFSDYVGQSPTGLFGVLQAASTTIAYDSGLYGCGLIKAFSYAAQSLTVTRTN